jgi:hypothetical protein
MRLLQTNGALAPDLIVAPPTRDQKPVRLRQPEAAS